MRAVGRPEAAQLLFRSMKADIDGTAVIDEDGLLDIAERTITRMYANGLIITETTMPTEGRGPGS